MAFYQWDVHPKCKHASNLRPGPRLMHGALLGSAPRWASCRKPQRLLKTLWMYLKSQNMSFLITYFISDKENWLVTFIFTCWCRSVLCGGSTSIFVYGYCCYFYAKSQMTGLLQFSFFFGNNACICYAFFLMLGTVAFCTSLIFVRHIYRAIKSE